MKKLLFIITLLLFVWVWSADYYKIVQEEICYTYTKAYPETGTYEECRIEDKKVWYSGEVPQEDVARYEAQKEIDSFYDNYVAQYWDDYLVPKYDEPVYHGPRWYGGWVDFWWYCIITL